MKKIYLLLSVFAMLFIACETDFDVNAQWEETTIVYGLLDASDEDTLQKIRISKAFLGEMDAYEMAQYADSINFDIDELDVMIYKWGLSEIEGSVSLNAVPTVREGDIFNDSIVVYEFGDVNSFLQKGYEYELVVKNNKSGNIVTSRTSIITEEPAWDNFNPNYDIGFYKNDLSDFHFKTIGWNKVAEGNLYQLNLIFKYLEINKETSAEESKSIEWLQDLKSSTSGSMSLKIEGEDFFDFLADEIKVDNNVIREYEGLFLEMTVGSEDLETYINVNKPITGIVQQRPAFTNINNGIGLFSTRFIYTQKIGPSNDELGGLNEASHYYINNILKRNFDYPFDDL
jgi:hypothetical protein